METLTFERVYGNQWNCNAKFDVVKMFVFCCLLFEWMKHEQRDWMSFSEFTLFFPSASFSQHEWTLFADAPTSLLHLIFVWYAHSRTKERFLVRLSGRCAATNVFSPRLCILLDSNTSYALAFRSEPENKIGFCFAQMHRAKITAKTLTFLLYSNSFVCRRFLHSLAS